MTKLSSLLTLLSLFLLLSVNSAKASVIAVVDSGTDFLHKDLNSKAWVNPLEVIDNDQDDDSNGYVDDINGWNFAEGSNILIDYSYSKTNTLDTRKFFEIQLRSFLGTITKADRDWVNDKRKDEAFIKNLQTFGNWMHGTHVTGITVKDSPEARAIGIKLIPTEVKLPGFGSIMDTLRVKATDDASAGNAIQGEITDFLLKGALTLLAQQQTQIYLDIGMYVNAAGADVLNGSFGASYQSISNIITQVFKTFFKRDPTAAELKTYTDHFFAVNLEETKKFLRASPRTLFVFAAGNEGTDNDLVPAAPANVDADNKISVAATLGDQALANFSCYGVKNVEVAAPGVGILSTTPMNNYLAVSGTSQAAPYVANIAGRVKDVNPKLGYREIKKIILETVDVKSWLVGKVKTSGLVNRERAIRAAELSRELDLSAAIQKAKVEIVAKPEIRASQPQYFQVPKELVPSLPSQFIFTM